MNITLRHTTFCISISAGFLTGCSTGPGRCIGVANSAQSATSKTLQNLDSNGVAIQGYDAVAFFSDSQPLAGNPEIRSTHDGAVYYFISVEHKASFDANPSKYVPQFGGYCAYAASIDTISPIDPAYWEIVNGRLLLQHNQRAWDAWHKDATTNLVKADRNWPEIVKREGSEPRQLVNVNESGVALNGYDPTSYFLDSGPRKGDPALSRTFQGATYYFVDAAHKNAFEKSPSTYLPQFGGFCGYAASINKVSPTDPEIWQVVDGKLVLQHTPEAFKYFNDNLAQNYAKAEHNWPGLSHRRCN